MTLPSSGSITIAQILAEIGDSYPVTIPNANWRTLAGKPTGSLVIPTDFYGKTWRSVTQTDSRITAATSHSAVSFGSDISGRWVVILAFHHNTSASPGQTPTATIGGVSATRIAAHSTGNGSGTASGVAMFVAQPVGATGTVAVTWGSLATTIVALRVTGYNMTSATSSGAKGSTGASLSIDIPTNGLLIGSVCRADETTAITWTNLTEKADESANGNRRSWGWDFPLALQTGRSVSYSPFSALQGANAVLAASFPALP